MARFAEDVMAGRWHGKKTIWSRRKMSAASSRRFRKASIIYARSRCACRPRRNPFDRLAEIVDAALLRFRKAMTRTSATHTDSGEPQRAVTMRR